MIIGSGGHAREALDVVEAINAVAPTYEMVGFLDDDAARVGTTVRGLPVRGPVEDLFELGDVLYFIGIGNCAGRSRVAQRLHGCAARATTLIHPRASLTAHCTFGQGALIAAGCVLTNNVTVGDHSHINIGASVSHDCTIEEFVHLAPGVRLAGNVTVRRGSEIGIGACVVPGIEVGEHTIVGAGAVVIRSLPARVTAAGVPARIIRSHSNDSGRERPS
ncbi:MAG: sugar O-acyltransferase, sialic acid O-acetyltransferase NeuD family [Gemmatimonadetes bacterium]|nr:sugar O-acyltransferase, sialic acid O-acetyltransferase NeuD family [Gemmatimonadota bacterium]